MAATAVAFVSAPVAANTPIAVFRKSGNDKALGSIAIKFENIGANAFTGKLQESADGTTYTDVAGATVTALAAKAESTLNVLTHKPYLRLAGSGNTSVRLDAMYEGRVLRGSLDILVLSSTGYTQEVQISYDNL